MTLYRSDVWSSAGRLMVAAAGCLAALVLTGSASAKPFEWRTDEIPGARAEGRDECLTCHEGVKYEVRPSYHADCESCHGGGSKHSQSEAIADIRFPASSDCLSCHEEGRSTHLEWRTSEHARAGVICADCHNTHNTAVRNVREVASQFHLPEIDDVSASCVSCHTEIAARLSLPSHHPVREGALSCIECHDPHGDSRTTLGDQAERCSSCHQRVAGPWVFEHPPAVEDCASCHDPHGSAMPNLLAQPMPIACIQCHSTADDRHHGGEFNLGGTTISGDYPTGTQAFLAGEAGVFDCTSCHGAIHGSHFDKHLRR